MTTCCERRTAARSHFAARDRVVKERWRATRVGSSFFDSALRAESRTTLDAPVSCPRYVGAFGSYAKRSGVSTVMLHDDDAFMSVVAPSPCFIRDELRAPDRDLRDLEPVAVLVLGSPSGRSSQA